MAMEMVWTHNVQPPEGSSILARQPGWSMDRNHGSFELFHQELAQSPLLHSSLPAILSMQLENLKNLRFMLGKLNVLPKHGIPKRVVLLGVFSAQPKGETER